MFHLLFVYGSLMTGFSGNVFLKDADFIGYGLLFGCKLVHLNSGYPAVIEGNGKVFGEVYKVDNFTLRAIDFFEEYMEELPEESLYLRVKKPVMLLPLKDFIDAWVYVLNREFLLNFEYVEILAGNWRDFIKKFLKL